MLKIISANLIITVALLEACSSVLLKDRIQRVFSEYLTTSTYNFGRRSYPRWHFSKNKKRGFDIKKDSSPVISSQPREIEPYFVFGNNIGCFDEIPISSQKYHVYLAGDSFTWGYAPLNKKFGTLLEDKLQKPVAACGVSHTGQIHQFSKFSDITNQLGYYPEHVIVNVYKNDIANDFSHPHTTVIKGYQVDYVLVRKKDQLLTREEISIATLLKKYDEESKRKSNTKLGKWDPRKYSATAVLASEVVLKPILNFILPKISKPSDSLKIYEVSHKESDFYPGEKKYRNSICKDAIVRQVNYCKKNLESKYLTEKTNTAILINGQLRSVKTFLSWAKKIVKHSKLYIYTDKSSFDNCTKIERKELTKISTKIAFSEEDSYYLDLIKDGMTINTLQWLKFKRACDLWEEEWRTLGIKNILKMRTELSFYNPQILEFYIALGLNDSFMEDSLIARSDVVFAFKINNINTLKNFYRM